MEIKTLRVEPVAPHMTKGTGEYKGYYFCEYCLKRPDSQSCWKKSTRRLSQIDDRVVYTCPGCFVKPERRVKYRVAVLRDVFGCRKVRTWLQKGVPLDYITSTDLPTTGPF